MMPQSLNFRHRILLILPLAALLFGLYAYFSLHTGAPEPLHVSAPAEPSAKYAARTLDGRLAIYRAGARYPMEVTDIEVDSLPLADQEALAEGIDLADEEAIAHLLEDYS